MPKMIQIRHVPGASFLSVWDSGRRWLCVRPRQ